MTRPISIYVSTINITVLPPQGSPPPTVEDLIGGLSERMDAMSKEIDDLTAAVAQDTDVVNSAVTLIGGLADQLRAVANDPAAITALADQLTANNAALADAVAANTVASPTA